MLLGIYLGTTAISIVTGLIFGVATKNNLKRKGYKFIKKEESFSEKLASTTSITFKMLFPVYNILNATFVLWSGSKFYDYMEKELLKSGDIYMDNEKNDENIYNINDVIKSENISYEKTTKEEVVNINDVDLTNNIDKPKSSLKRILRPKK